MLKASTTAHYRTTAGTSSEDARIVMVGLTGRGETRLQTVLPLLDELQKVAIKGKKRSEPDEMENVFRTMRTNLANHLSKESKNVNNNYLSLLPDV